MRKKSILLVVLVLIFIAFSCKKEEESKQKTKTELLTQHTWKTSGMTIDPSLPIYDNQGNIIGYTNDVWAQLPACVKDNFFKYNSDGTTMSDEGPTKCEDTDPQTTTGTWVFNQDETIITESDGQGNSVSYNILQLNENSFEVSYSEKIENVTYTLTVTSIPK